MKNYEKPKIIAILIEAEDIVSTSTTTPGHGDNELPMISGDEIFG